MADITCVGILCADALAKPVNALPEKGKLQLLEELQLQVGGCAANTAIGLAKLGIDTAIIGKIGNDGFGGFIQNALTSEGVNISKLRVDDSVQTSASVVAISDDGERSILHCLGANAKFGFDDICLKTIINSKILFIAGTFLMPDFDGIGMEKLLKEVKQSGVLCCMDTAWDSTGQWMSKIENVLPYLDWFMPSFEEAKELAGKSSPIEMAKVFMGKGVKNVVIKVGGDGCYVQCQNNPIFHVPAYKNINVVDTSGAGDAFCAGFLAGLMKEWDIQTCAKFANAVAAHCVMSIGTTTGIKSMPQIVQFITRNDNINGEVHV